MNDSTRTQRTEVLTAGPAEGIAGLLGVDLPDLTGGGLPPLWHWVYLLDRPAQCDLGPDGQATGEQLLQRADLQPVMEYSALGGIVCQIGVEGCGFPEQSCWCQCKRDPCVYWQYFQQVEGAWVYATIGASTRIVQAGQVDGWGWGAGDRSDGAFFDGSHWRCGANDARRRELDNGGQCRGRRSPGRGGRNGR